MADELGSLRSEASGFRNAVFAQSTKKTYKSQVSCYIKFCLNFGLTPVPASQEMLVTYCSYLARSLSASSIPAYLNVIRLLHVEAGLPNPLQNNWEISSIQKGISRLMGKPPTQKSPVTVKILLDLYSTLDGSSADIAFWAACLVAFYGFLRKSTLLPDQSALKSGKYIARADLINLTLASFSIVVRHSKTIQFGQRLLKLPYVSSLDVSLCPVRAVFRHFGTSEVVAARPLFDFIENGKVVSFTHAWFVKRLKAGLLRTGNKASEISCHSFRRGGATLAFSVGMSATDIKLRGDWSSNAYEKYLVVSPETLISSVHLLTQGAAALSLR
jgi:hypothetical protein